MYALEEHTVQAGRRPHLHKALMLLAGAQGAKPPF